MCNVSFNPPPLAHRYGRENMFRLCTQLFQCHVFCCLLPRMRKFFLGVPCTQMFYIIFYVSFPPTLANKFLHYVPTRAHIDHAKIFLLAFFMYGQKLNLIEKKNEFCIGDKVGLQREEHVDTQFSQIPYCVLFIFFVSLKNHTKRLMLSLRHKQPRRFILEYVLRHNFQSLRVECKDCEFLKQFLINILDISFAYIKPFRKRSTFNWNMNVGSNIFTTKGLKLPTLEFSISATSKLKAFLRIKI